MEYVDKFIQMIKNNPAAVFGYIAAFVNLALQLGYLDASQGEAILATVESLALIAGGYVVRAAVVPTRKVKNRDK